MLHIGTVYLYTALQIVLWCSVTYSEQPDAFYVE